MTKQYHIHLAYPQPKSLAPIAALIRYLPNKCIHTGHAIMHLTYNHLAARANKHLEEKSETIQMLHKEIFHLKNEPTVQTNNLLKEENEKLHKDLKDQLELINALRIDNSCLSKKLNRTINKNTRCERNLRCAVKKIKVLETQIEEATKQLEMFGKPQGG